MHKKLFLVLAVVLSAGTMLARAQDSQQKAATEHSSDAQNSEKSGKEQPAEKSKPAATPADYPSNFPEFQEPVELHLPRGTRVTLKMTDSTHAVYESICQQAKINVLFDPDYTPRTITVNLNNISLEDALKIVAFESRTFWRPLTSDAIFVAADNSGKRRELEQQIVKTFYFPNVYTPTDLQDLVNALRTIVEIQRIQQVPSVQSVIVRATPEQMALAERILNELNASRQRLEGEYRLQCKINETNAGENVSSRTYTMLVDRHQTGKLHIGPRIPVLTDENEQSYLDAGKNLDFQIRLVTEHAIGLHITVDFSAIGQDEQGEHGEHGAADSRHRNPILEQTMMETTVMLALGTPVNVGSFQDPVSKHSFQIEVAAVRTKSSE